MPSLSFFLLPVLLVSSVSAAPKPVPIQERKLQRRALSDILNGLQNGVTVEDITQGILPNYFDKIPSTNDIYNQLGVSSSTFNNAPLEVLNIPSYANWSNNAWNLHMHAWAYKQPLNPDNNNNSVVSTTALDKAANVFLPNFNIGQLQPHEQDNARNLTSAILSVPQSNVQLEFLLTVQASQGQNFSGSGSTAKIVWPSQTDSRGEIDGFIPLPVNPPNGGGAWLPDGSQTNGIVRLDVHTNNTDTGNSTAYLIPPQGVIIVSDIDDTLRVTKIWQPTQGLLNTFARDFVPWLNMPSNFARWSTQHPEQPYHFHYLTTTPEQATRKYMDFIYNYYPLGSFDTRPLNFTTVDQTFAIRKVLLDRILQTFPNRKFVLFGDTSNSDIMTDYPEAAKNYGDRVQCILLRNVSATDTTNRFPYNTKGFQGLDANRYMFFRTPDDLAGLDFGNGDCRNASVPQGVTYGWQNLPFGVTSDGGKVRGDRERVWWVLGVAVVVGWWVGS
ncbi:hypothetical protein K440DRAFT_581663 [Wilcoxina mikolae CBS 423.85]|nr:hypothetical protein K440DRAFT_581663 [Wilcoxina mikolae CBS 423.85]